MAKTTIEVIVCDCCGKLAEKQRTFDVCGKHATVDLKLTPKWGGNRAAKKDVVKMPCPICGKDFAARGLKNHIRSHDPDRRIKATVVDDDVAVGWIPV